MLITYADHWAVPLKLIAQKLCSKLFAFKFLPFKDAISHTASGTVKDRGHHGLPSVSNFKYVPLAPQPIYLLSIYPREIPEQVHTGTFTWISTNPFLLLLLVLFLFWDSEELEQPTCPLLRRKKSPVGGIHSRIFYSIYNLGTFVIHYQEATLENLSHLYPEKLR